jgi:hypothetical protein
MANVNAGRKNVKPLKTVNIKGKEYVQVNERLKYFREHFAGWGITTEIIGGNENEVTMKATVTRPDGTVASTGHALEDRRASYINKTSHIENAETSAVGRALGNLGIGLDTSVASAEEVEMAVARQEVANA